ncbi:helix-turn-helix domain-containing protein [Streptomyces iconiensis]|uniref:Helix-turn-helix transcriptional regulator n=1 Tax=Streptomyces iconiensis TaxID=1384038 RepID=A0ABT6ZYL1_9ACTN|nr:helix-turn-helix transcriptional regulator [Streptomyces iconiensis]MDJ1134151.1 helix-turn-helix transcriptional regulator [Streptomyces iconiensis]
MDETAVGWEVSVPVGGVRADGMQVAAFRDRLGAGLDMRVLPQPVVTVVVGFGDDALVVDGTTGRQTLASLVATPFPGPTRIRGARVECVEVQLSPVVASSLLGIAPAELDGVVTDLDAIWGRQAGRLREQLADATTWPQRFALVDEFLGHRRARAQAVDPEVAAGWEHIVVQHGRVRVGDLAAYCGWSRKRLWSRFSAQLGLTPKRAAMLVRFDHAVRSLRAGDDPAEVATACGYVDQPHLHRDVLAFAGCTPGALTDTTEGKRQQP